MINSTVPTVISFSNETAPLVIKSVIETNQSQYWISLIVSLLVAFWFVLYVVAKNGSLSNLVYGFKIKRLTGRPTLIIKHTDTSMFTDDYINGKTLTTITKFLNKHNHKPVNIVLHTPGGSIFHSMAASKAIKTHGSVHVYVPVMAMSGGTLLSLSSHKLYMLPNAALGPVDPQLGLIWTQGSADDWKLVVRKKGVKAGDTAFIMNNEGVKYTKLISDHMLSLGLPKKMVLELTVGKAPHGKLYYYNDITAMGFVVEPVYSVVKPKLYDVLVKAVTS